MAELPRTSPTAGLPGIAGAGVTVVETPDCDKLLLRLSEAALLRANHALGFPVPTAPLSSSEAAGAALLWLGPDEWLMTLPAGMGAQAAARLDHALDGTHRAVVDVSHRSVVLRLRGPAARDALAAGCPIDLHPTAFPPGAVTRTVLGKAGIVLHLHGDGETFDLHVDRSFADYAWLFLANAARELNAA
ncbi:MAG: sarcosine oxidase subunit gamma family protein [Geminicoccaceae bacterium]